MESLARQYEIRTIARFLALLNNGSFVVSPTEDEVTLQPAPPKYASKYEDLVLQQMGKKYGSL